MEGPKMLSKQRRSVFECESLANDCNDNALYVQAQLWLDAFVTKKSNEGNSENSQNDLAFHFGHFLLSECKRVNAAGGQLGTEQINLITLVGVRLTIEINRQNTCFVLNELMDEFARNESLPPVTLPVSSNWENQLCQTAFVGPDSVMQIQHGYIYLTRYCDLENNLADFVALGQNKSPAQFWLPENPFTEPGLANLMGELFEPSESFNWQQHAVLNSLTHRFSVITGGPGTGKTTTVLKLLAALLSLHNNIGGFAKQAAPKLSIALVAPTGKAALRLSESIKSGISRLLVSDEIKQKLPKQASTIHRLLKPQGPNSFFYNEHNKLALNVLILDEASMVDIGMMAKLFKALPDSCQVVMLGDQYQLSSVEAGNMLAEFCLPLKTLDTNAQKRPMPLTELKVSYRFDDNSQIGQLARLVNNRTNSREPIKLLLERNQYDVTGFANGRDLYWLDPKVIGLSVLINLVVARQETIVRLAKSMTPENEQSVVAEIFDVLNELQVLACVREGTFGVNGINETVKRALAQQRLIDWHETHYIGRPILIEENAYHLALFNGDVGIQLQDPNTNLLMTYFRSSEQVTKVFNQRLPKHSSVYAMTVHKSQGSEFDHSILVLPVDDIESGTRKPMNKVLSKELLYTGITRAKTKFTVFGELHTIITMAHKKNDRQSGIATMLFSKNSNG
jgi:exodeoxyribonuclease V alpha subunit